MPPNHHPPRSQTFILRLWEERLRSDDHPNTWRFSLEETQTRERRVFVGVEAMCAYLTTQTKSDLTHATDESSPDVPH